MPKREFREQELISASQRHRKRPAVQDSEPEKGPYDSFTLDQWPRGSMTRQLRQQAVLRMQQTHGNAAVRRMVTDDYYQQQKANNTPPPVSPSTQTPADGTANAAVTPSSGSNSGSTSGEVGGATQPTSFSANANPATPIANNASPTSTTQTANSTTPVDTGNAGNKQAVASASSQSSQTPAIANSPTPAMLQNILDYHMLKLAGDVALDDTHSPWLSGGFNQSPDQIANAVAGPDQDTTVTAGDKSNIEDKGFERLTPYRKPNIEDEESFAQLRKQH